MDCARIHSAVIDACVKAVMKLLKIHVATLTNVKTKPVPYCRPIARILSEVTRAKPKTAFNVRLSSTECQKSGAVVILTNVSIYRAF